MANRSRSTKPNLVKEAQGVEEVDAEVAVEAMEEVDMVVDAEEVVEAEANFSSMEWTRTWPMGIYRPSSRSSER